MKKCTKCGETKELSEFGKDKTRKLGLNPYCKSCYKELNKKWRLKNKGKISKWGKEYRLNNKDRIKEYSSKYSGEYYEKNKDRIKEYSKNYYNKNKDRYLLYNKEYYNKNKDIISIQYKEWYNKNNEYIKTKRKENREKTTKYMNTRRKTEPLFNLKSNLRSRTYQAFSYMSWKKGGSTEQLLGIDYKRCKLHLERQFTKGMNWSNHGEWHIDHIIPLSSATNEVELRKLCHYTNLQPLWAYDNISKGAKIPEVQIQLRI